jgi:NADH:ubiquinone oxidoreductase subunit E
MDEQEKYALLTQVIEEYEGKPSNLIQVLHYAQSIFGFVGAEVQRVIAQKMDLPLAKITGVLTFYSFFSIAPRGRHIISVCLGTACFIRGGQPVLDRLKEILGIDVGETTDDQRFSLEIRRCIGACGMGPSLIIDEQVFKRLNVSGIEQILDKFE